MVQPGSRPAAIGRWGLCVLCVLPGLLPACATADAQRGGIVLSVVVRDANSGDAVIDAEVAILDLKVRARTDSHGRALFASVPPTAGLLRVRRLGYEPLVTPFRPSGSDTVRVAVRLEPVAQRLPRTVVTDSEPFSPLPEFESRRGKRVGRFITEREIRAAFGSRFSDLVLAKIPGLRIRDLPGGGAIAYSTRGPRSIHGDQCTVDVYLDGVRVFGGEVDLVPLHLLAGIEYYTPGFVPVQYRRLGAAPGEGGGSAACGVLLLWTVR